MKILITGGCGSLGKAFIRLLHDHELTVIDNSEWSVAECRKEWPNVRFILDDFVNYRFDQEPVDALIHLAAYKHIDLGEENPIPFIENNINKTRRLFEEAYRFGVDILFVSTDKAVEPHSLYGYSKAIGEHLAKHFGGCVARLGNILSSSGSVIPLWEKAIAEGRPIPITDERMTRYFIEDYDAVNQIWHDFLGGERLIIPKCEHIRLLDLLKKVLERHNKTIDEVEVEMIGLRPGEKLDEKLRWDNEL